VRPRRRLGLPAHPTAAALLALAGCPPASAATCRVDFTEVNPDAGLTYKGRFDYDGDRITSFPTDVGSCTAPTGRPRGHAG